MAFRVSIVVFDQQDNSAYQLKIQVLSAPLRIRALCICFCAAASLLSKSICMHAILTTTNLVRSEIGENRVCILQFHILHPPPQPPPPPPIVGKSIKYSTDKKITRRNNTEAKIKICPIKLCTVRRIFIELWGTTYKD